MVNLHVYQLIYYSHHFLQYGQQTLFTAMDTCKDPPLLSPVFQSLANFFCWRQSITNEEFVGHNKYKVDQLWVVDSAESIFECHTDVPVRLGARKTWFSLKKGVYFFWKASFVVWKVDRFFNENHVFLAPRRTGTSLWHSKMLSADSTTQSWSMFYFW